MKYRWSNASVLFFCVFQSMFARQLPVKRNLFNQVRVQLHEWNHSKPIQLTTSNGFTLWQKSSKKVRSVSDVSIRCINGKLLVNNALVDHCYIRPKDGSASFDGKTYQGSFFVVKNKNSAQLINALNLEDYVSSVLRTESWPGWPLEVNKVFAITSRTYVMAMMQKARKKNQFYDVKNTNAHQTYQGIHTCKTIKDAVAQTKGIFLAHKKEPILAMFDSCCGGVVPAHIANFNFSKTPYLARKYACKHCKRCNIYCWKAEYTIADFEKEINSKVKKDHKFKEIKVAKKDKAGLVQEVALKGHPHNCLISGQKLCSLMKEFKSYCYCFQKKAGKIIVDGRGFGHHIGLCQWGAREMVRDGWPHKRILQFYYPSTSFMKLT